MTNSRRKRKQKRNGRICISLIAIMFLVIMSVQIVKLYQKEQEYTAREKALTESLEDETERQNQLDNYEEYTKSQEYIEDQAKSKLGLTHENEIIFKEDKKYNSFENIKTIEKLKIDKPFRFLPKTFLK